MEFKEYLEFSQLQEDIDFINEGLGSTLMGMVDAGVSATGTAGKQILRGTGNTVRGIGGLATHGLGSVFGNEKSRKDAKNKLGSSLKRTLRGLGQLATSPYATAVRGLEAGRDPFSKLKPDSGSGWGEMMGIRSRPELEQKPEKQNYSFEDLLGMYRNAKTETEKMDIFSKMKKLYPREFELYKIKVIKDRIKAAKKILGFNKGDKITRTTLKQKYFELAKIYHPDKGGSPEDFKKIQKAYNLLEQEISKREKLRKAI